MTPSAGGHTSAVAEPRDSLSWVHAVVVGRKVAIAPRQTGKASALLALRDLLNTGAEGDYRCVYVNVEPARTAREDVARAMRNILNGISRQARMTVGDAAAGEIARSLDVAGDPDGALGEFLALWCEADPRPLILLYALGSRPPAPPARPAPSASACTSASPCPPPSRLPGPTLNSVVPGGQLHNAGVFKIRKSYLTAVK